MSLFSVSAVGVGIVSCLVSHALSFGTPPDFIYEEGVQFSQRAQLIDVNGDGLPDFVNDWYEGSGPGNSVSEVFLNTGGGWAAPGEWRLDYGQLLHNITVTFGSVRHSFALCRSTSQHRELVAALQAAFGIPHTTVSLGLVDSDGRHHPVHAMLPPGTYHLTVAGTTAPHTVGGDLPSTIRQAANTYVDSTPETVLRWSRDDVFVWVTSDPLSLSEVDALVLWRARVRGRSLALLSVPTLVDIGVSYGGALELAHALLKMVN